LPQEFDMGGGDGGRWQPLRPLDDHAFIGGALIGPRAFDHGVVGIGCR